MPDVIATPNHPIRENSLEALRCEAVEKLLSSGEGIVRWIDNVRDARPGRIRWAIETTREANVASTAYALSGIRKMGLFDGVITEADKREGIAWIRSMAVGNGEFRDPALVDRRSPDWPADKPWPDSGMSECNNRYAQSILALYGEPEGSPSPPPPGWPQLGEGPEKALQWIRERPWSENAWGSGSWTAKMMKYLLDWHLEGHLSLDPVIDALNHVYSIQDPDSGLWGDPSLPLQNRINGTFKLFHFMRAQLDLPLRHAEKMIDRVFERLYDPVYEIRCSGCDEFDNWYVVHHARPETGDYRREEVEKMAAYRIASVLDAYTKPDGGISFLPDSCQQSWVGFDMAPKLPQGDAMGLGLITSGVSTAVELCGLVGETPWLGLVEDTNAYPQELKDTITEQIRLH